MKTLKNWFDKHHPITGFEIVKQTDIDSKLRNRYIKKEKILTPLL